MQTGAETRRRSFSGCVPVGGPGLCFGRQPANRSGRLCSNDSATRKSALRLEFRAAASCDGPPPRIRFPELGSPALDGVNTLYDFDDHYTAPRNGFGTADEYYRRCSLGTALARIQVPGLIVHAMDDPFVASEPLIRAQKPDDLAVELVPNGGHLGYLSRRRWQGDRRWLDARLAAWLKTHWAALLSH